MKLVQLTRLDGSPIEINPDDVELVRPADEEFIKRQGRTEIVLVSGATQVVKERLEDVLKALNT